MLDTRTKFEKIYAGITAKAIGVRLGAPVEPTIWSYERVRDTYGEVTGYLRDFKNFAADDDTNGPVYFIRALRDYGLGATAADVGRTWLNYAAEEHGMYWWGGFGVSTEHTAYRNLRAGIPAPLSGAIATNGHTVAEQIGGQIFIDSWGWVNPGNPKKAAEISARRFCRPEMRAVVPITVAAIRMIITTGPSPGMRNQFIADITAEALYADQLGTHSAWIGEHHFNSLGVLSCPDLVLSYVAANTKHIRLAPAVTVLPLHNPIRVAEQWATLDLLSGGRVDFAAGRGYDRREYEPFHVSFEDNQGIFEEGLELVRELWRADGRISHHGKHYSFDDVRITPSSADSGLASATAPSSSFHLPSRSGDTNA